MRKACTAVEWFEDYEVGDEFAGEPVAFTEEKIIRFARRYDPQPFHIDRVVAAASQFEGIIASAIHIHGATWGGLINAGFLNGRAMGALGIDDFRVVKPVRPGDTITLYALVRETQASSTRTDRGYVTFDHRAENQNGEVVWTMTIPQIIARRPT